MHTVHEMSAQLSRKRALNLLEAAVATAVIAGGMVTTWTPLERLVAASAVACPARHCLRCALALYGAVISPNRFDPVEQQSSSAAISCSWRVTLTATLDTTAAVCPPHPMLPSRL
jgi:uncharacterized membrane protein YadS